MDQASSTPFPNPGDNSGTCLSDQGEEPHSPRPAAQPRVSSGHLDSRAKDPRHTDTRPRKVESDSPTRQRGLPAHSFRPTTHPESPGPASGDLDLLNQTVTSIAGIMIGVLSLAVPFLSVAMDRRASIRLEAPPGFVQQQWTPAQEHQRGP